MVCRGSLYGTYLLRASFAYDTSPAPTNRTTLTFALLDEFLWKLLPALVDSPGSTSSSCLFSHSSSWLCDRNVCTLSLSYFYSQGIPHTLLINLISIIGLSLLSNLLTHGASWCHSFGRLRVSILE
jgi:hypothetical protein